MYCSATLHGLGEAFTQVGHDAAGLPVLALPYLVLMKLTAMRSQDWADVSRMLGLATETELEQVRDVVRRYSPEDAGRPGSADRAWPARSSVPRPLT